jgi:hypothetical protein
VIRRAIVNKILFAATATVILTATTVGNSDTLNERNDQAKPQAKPVAIAVPVIHLDANSDMSVEAVFEPRRSAEDYKQIKYGAGTTKLINQFTP